MKTLFLFLSGLLTASICVAEQYSASEKFSQTYPVAADVRFDLNNVNGSVEIIGWDKNEVSVEADKRAATPEDLAKVQIDVSASDKSVSVNTKNVSGGFGRKAKNAVIYVIHVPASAKLEKIKVVNAEVTIKGVQGEVNVDSVNGTIHAEVGTQNATLSTVNGSVLVHLTPSTDKHSLYVHSVNGGCKVALPEKFNGSFDASTVNGKISCSFPKAKLTGSNRSLQGAFGDSTGTAVEASTVNGSILFEPL